MKPYWRDEIMIMNLEAVKEEIEDIMEEMEPGAKSILRDNEYDLENISKQCDNAMDKIFNSCTTLLNTIDSNRELVGAYFNIESDNESIESLKKENNKLKERIRTLENALIDSNKTLIDHIVVLSENTTFINNSFKAAYGYKKVADIVSANAIDGAFNNRDLIVNIDNSALHPDINSINRKLSDIESKLNTI